MMKSEETLQQLYEKGIYCFENRVKKPTLPYISYSELRLLEWILQKEDEEETTKYDNILNVKEIKGKREKKK